MDRIEIRRVRDPAPSGSDKDCTIFLVDRLWPRGVSKDEISMDAWLKEVAPSAELRKWFGHDPQRWDEFRRRYLNELDNNSEAAGRLIQAARQGRVVLLFDAKDTDHNQAVVLREWLLRQI